MFNQQGYFSSNTIWVPNMSQLLGLLPTQVVSSDAGGKRADLEFWDMVKLQKFQENC